MLDRLGGREWSLIGCAGTEERSVALPLHLGRARLSHTAMIAIRDPEPLDAVALDGLLAQRAAELEGVGFTREEIPAMPLLSGLDEIRRQVTAIVDAGAQSLLLDITSMPKLWFFPMLQAILEDDRLSDVVVTYTSGTQYADILAENIGPLRTLPGFFAEDGRSEHASIVVGIGFEPLGLLPLLQDADRIRLIFPFPPGPPGHRRNWMFVKQIEALTQGEGLDTDRVHIHMYDAPQVFDALCEMTMQGHETSAFAPYGPKTVSLAMCLFALAAHRAGRPRVPVFYAQPLRYALNYTGGIGRLGLAPDTTAYCVRLNGRNLYDLP